jgi:hypothetical protein
MHQDLQHSTRAYKQCMYHPPPFQFTATPPSEEPPHELLIYSLGLLLDFSSSSASAYILSSSSLNILTAFGLFILRLYPKKVSKQSHNTILARVLGWGLGGGGGG